MRVSAKCDYACKALLELALHWPDKEPLQIHEISEKQDIPIKYLVQILIQLKRIGFVDSIRGKEGGYNLAIAPDKITLGKVMREIGGPLLPMANHAVKNEQTFGRIWHEVENVMAKVLDKVTFEDIVNKARGREKAVVYQI